MRKNDEKINRIEKNFPKGQRAAHLAESAAMGSWCERRLGVFGEYKPNVCLCVKEEKSDRLQGASVIWVVPRMLSSHMSGRKAFFIAL